MDYIWGLSTLSFRMKYSKIIIALSIICIPIVACGQKSDPERYANSITEQELRELLYVYASDYFEGRDTGSAGEDLACGFLRSFYQDAGIEAAAGTENYYQVMTIITRKGDAVLSKNVAAIIPGKEKPEEFVIITAHLDHLGRGADGTIYNGADDNGSGNVAILEIAEAFQTAVNDGHGPKRSIVFLHVSGEEKGLLGSKYYTDKDPLYPLANTVANLNIDMIGRLDPKRDDPDPNYIYLIGSDKLSEQLHDLSEEVNAKYTKINLDYTYNADDDPNRFYYRSDHYNFAKKNIPIIFYFNGIHEDYHKSTDTVEKINYDILTNRTRLIFHTVWEIANRAERIKLTTEEHVTASDKNSP